MSDHQAIPLSDEQLQSLMGGQPSQPQRELTLKEKLLQEFMTLNQSIDQQRFQYGSNYVSFCAEITKILLKESHSSSLSEPRVSTIIEQAILFTNTFRKRIINYQMELMESAPIAEQLLALRKKLEEEILVLDKQEQEDKALGQIKDQLIDPTQLAKQDSNVVSLQSKAPAAMGAICGAGQGLSFAEVKKIQEANDNDEPDKELA